MNNKKTFHEVSEIWCDAKRPIVKHSTLCAYQLTLQTHLLPRFGAAENITEKDVQQFVIYNPQIEMFARFKMKSSFHKTKRII